jgi:DNA-binding NarL/FixJ family response regulator
MDRSDAITILTPRRAQTCEAIPDECGLALDGCPVERLRRALAHAEALLSQREQPLVGVKDNNGLHAMQEDALRLVARLTQRQHEIMALLLQGMPSKNIAADLHISQRTVENHRAAIMKKTESKSVPALARLGVACASDDARKPSVQGKLTIVG